MTDWNFLDELYTMVCSRKKADPEVSYVAKLFHRGRKKMAQKVGEEAVEIAIEAVADKRKNTINESADLLFHVLVLWADMKIKPADVIEQLKQRKGVSGLEEKHHRKK